jgi:uncharacterized membrane protein YheB (UPF0754 family)
MENIIIPAEQIEGVLKKCVSETFEKALYRAINLQIHNEITQAVSGKAGLLYKFIRDSVKEVTSDENIKKEIVTMVRKRFDDHVQKGW